MPISSRLCLLLAVSAVFVVAGAASDTTGDIVDVTLTPALRKYCHIIRFPQGWKIQPFDDHGQRLTISTRYSDYGFRVQGLPGARFLVGAFTPAIKHPYPAANHYRVDLSDPTSPVSPASDEDWSAGTTVPLVRRYNAFPDFSNGGPILFNGFRFPKSGARWAVPWVSRLSPNSAWLVLQSFTTGGVSPRTQRGLAKLFIDVFNANTGDKVVAIEANHSGYFGPDSEGVLLRTAWLTERYLIVPLGEHRERYLVCKFGASKGKPEAEP